MWLEVYTFKKYPTLVGHTNENGKHDYYSKWHLDVDGSAIAEDYPRQNLTPEDVDAIMAIVEGQIDDVIYDLIDEALDEYLGSR